jgi:predicted ArsR family transcriptional regulator
LKKSNFYYIFSDMKSMKGITISEMAKELGIDKNAVAQRLFVAKIKPLSREALYALSALEAIRNVPSKGRPKKQPEAKPAKARKSPGKAR